MQACNFPTDRVVVLLGGDSTEREISLQSGLAVISALEARGRIVRPLDPHAESVAEFGWEAGDVAFIALHGRFGEDGQVQRILDRLGIPYTGSRAEPSRVAFSKSAAKLEFLRHDVPTPAYVTIHHSNSIGRLRRMAEAVGYPLVVKPDQQGSSLGVSFVEHPGQLAGAVAKAFEFGSLGVMERAILGSEWTVGLLDDVALPPIKITTARPIFDFESKYVDEATGYDFESDVSNAFRERLTMTARRASRCLGVCGLSRVDIRLDAAGSPWVLEVNTVPGLTDHSLVPKAAAQGGLTLGELCERTIASAVARHAARQNPQVPHVQPVLHAERRAG